MTQNEIFEKLYASYCNWYNMELCGEEKTPLSASGIFNSTDISYLLIEKAKMWSTNSNDYLFIFRLDRLTADDFSRLTAMAKEMGEKHIVPDKNHKSSYVTALFICESADKDAIEALRKYRFRKDFAFGFKGWEEVHTALVTADDGSVCSNRDGLNTAKYLKSVLYPKRKKFF